MGTSIEEEIITREETTRILPESSTNISFIFYLYFHWPPWWKKNIFTLCLQMAHFMAQKVAERKFPKIDFMVPSILSVNQVDITYQTVLKIKLHLNPSTTFVWILIPSRLQTNEITYIFSNGFWSFIGPKGQRIPRRMDHTFTTATGSLAGSNSTIHFG
jgi:hypothetical protein